MSKVVDGWVHVDPRTGTGPKVPNPGHDCNLIIFEIIFDPISSTIDYISFYNLVKTQIYIAAVLEVLIVH